MGVNLRAGVWHGVLTPLDRAADFLVVDREGAGVNLEEVAISPVSIENARLNMQAELPGWDFEATAAAADRA